MTDLALVTTDDDIATITMNRPDKRNALSVGLIEALWEALAQVAAMPEVRGMILTGAGKSFCAGMDLQGVIDDADAMAGMLQRLTQVTGAIRRLPVPTIAQVQGAAVGGGCGLMVVTDFAVTHPEAKIGYPEVSLGVCPAVVAPWLIQKIGAGAARAMLLGGGTIPGSKAHTCGLATHLAERDRVAETAVGLARSLAKGGPEAMAVTKRWLNELDGSLAEDVFDKAAALSAEVIAGPEAQQRLRKLFGS